MRALELTGPETIVGLLALALVAFPLAAAAPVPRPAPALAIVEASGSRTELSSFRGKVVVIEFLLTRCPHCWKLAETIGKLDRELGPRGLRAVGIAFDNDAGAHLVADFAKASRVAFPVGYASAESVDAFLGREPSERFQVPQIVVIDRAGAIRAQSRPTGETRLEDADSLRRLIDGLLAEKAPG